MQARAWSQWGMCGGGNYLSAEAAFPCELKRYSICIVQWRTEQDTVKTSQPTRVGSGGGDQIIFTEERFTLDKPSSSFSTFHHHHLSLLCYVKNWGEIWNTVIPKTFLLNLRSKSMFSARAHTHPHTSICTSIFVRALLGRMYEPASCRKPSPFHNPNLNLNPILTST